MSTLAMALAVTLATGSAPAKVSGETRQVLDLSGVWEGIFDQGDGRIGEVSLSGGILTGKGEARGVPFIVQEEIRGELRLLAKQQVCQGIYRFRESRLDLCFSMREDYRPTCFRAGDGQLLLTLRRVKPRK